MLRQMVGNVYSEADVEDNTEGNAVSSSMSSRSMTVTNGAGEVYIYRISSKDGCFI